MMLGIWCLMFIGDRVFEMHRSETARYEWDRHYHRCFILFFFHRRKAFCSIICELNVSLAHLPSSMEHAHTRLKNRFSRGKCFTYLRFFLSIKDRLFALSSGRKKKKRSTVESLTFRFFMVVFELRCLFATHVCICTLYNGYLCFV